MSKPLGYYGLAHSFLDSLQNAYGSQLEDLTYEQKLVFRAAIASYIAAKPVWQGSISMSCIDCCIEGAGADWNIWDEDPELVEIIQKCAYQLEDNQLEALIEALTDQIRDSVYRRHAA